MSEEIYELFNEEQVQIATRIEARRIRTGINDAQNNWEQAGRRWPFELLQNAHDTGPFTGREFVDIAIKLEDIDGTVKLLFHHNGAPFEVRELAALLSGGSSKEFDSEDTTGRFGTGFLVTHVLATEVVVQGILKNKESMESFGLSLYRGGDEDSIIKNIDSSKLALRDALPLDSRTDHRSASFEYSVASLEAAHLGLKSVREALPYLFSTCPHLGIVTLSGEDGVTEIWSKKETETHEYEEGIIKEVRIEQIISDKSERELRSVAAILKESGGTAAIIIAEKNDQGWGLCLPAKGLPRVFRRFPIQTCVLPLTVIMDGTFDIDQERQKIPLTDRNKILLEQVMRSIPTAVNFAYSQDWHNKHLLARVERPSELLTASQEDSAWWREQFAVLATKLAESNLVQSKGKLGPALNKDSDWCADFLLPQLNLSSSTYQLEMDRVWPLIEQVEHLCPPDFMIAADWNVIAANWAKLGLNVHTLALEDLVGEVIQEASRFDELPITSDKSKWLVRFLDAMGESWINLRVEHLEGLDGLLPDQLGNLRKHKELKRDGGISEELKNIADAIGLDIRSRLFDRNLSSLAESLKLNYFSSVIDKLFPGVLTEENVIEECITVLNKKLIEGSKASVDSSFVKGSIALLAYLWHTMATLAEEIAKRCPLVVSDDSVAKWSSTRMMMAPIEAWHSAARPFHGAYPPSRVLSAAYFDEPGSEELTKALVTWGMAIADPLTTTAPELKGKRLQGIALATSETDGVTLNGRSFSQIALLNDAVLLHCQRNVQNAKSLLGLVLTYVAKQDDQWNIWKDVEGTKDRKPIKIRVRGAVWVADLTTKAWVPIDSEEETSTAFAKAATIKDLLESDWLLNNNEGVSLLSECFGFDALDSQLLGVEPSKRLEVRDNLAKILQISQSDPSTLSEFVTEIEDRESRRRDVGKWRELGLAVQDAVQTALEAKGLDVRVVDRGFDFEVLVKAKTELEEAALAMLEVGPYFLEVKATTRGEVKMTPTQAIHASQNADRYALCVIDLRGISDADLAEDWSTKDVENLSHIVSTIGLYTSTTTELVEEAKGSDVGIRNDSALRYGVPTHIWDVTTSINDWVNSIADNLN